MTGFQGIRHDSESRAPCILRSPSIYPATTLATPPPPTKVAAMNSFVRFRSHNWLFHDIPKTSRWRLSFQLTKVLWSSASVTKSFAKCLMIYTNEPTRLWCKRIPYKWIGVFVCWGAVSLPLRCWQVIYNAEPWTTTSPFVWEVTGWRQKEFFSVTRCWQVQVIDCVILGLGRIGNIIKSFPCPPFPFSLLSFSSFLFFFLRRGKYFFARELPCGNSLYETELPKLIRQQEVLCSTS